MEKPHERRKWALGMGLSKIRQAESLAVLTHYERNLLEQVCDTHTKSPNYRFTLVAESEWTLLEALLEVRPSCKIYFVDTKNPYFVIFEAVLHSVNFELAKQNPNSLFKINFATLYEISHCQAFPMPFPTSTFRKIIDNEPISLATDFSLVYELQEGKQLIG